MFSLVNDNINRFTAELNLKMIFGFLDTCKNLSKIVIELLINNENN